MFIQLEQFFIIASRSGFVRGCTGELSSSGWFVVRFTGSGSQQ